MNIKQKQKKKITNCYKDLQQFYFRNNKKELEFDDKPFKNFISLLYPILSKNKYYNDDIFITSIISYMGELEEISDDIDDLISI